MVQDTHRETAPLSEACRRAETSASRLDLLTSQWHTNSAEGELDMLEALHAANFELWHLEDQARDPHATDAQIARTKHAIDAVNQRRNDQIEQIDEALLEQLGKVETSATTPLHSETPGQILDRLSILSLKLFHTAEEAVRMEAGLQHRERSAARYSVLLEQQRDLAACLTVLWQQIIRGERRFKRYHQYKMYNDPQLNPVLYRAGPGADGTGP